VAALYRIYVELARAAPSSRPQAGPPKASGLLAMHHAWQDEWQDDVGARGSTAAAGTPRSLGCTEVLQYSVMYTVEAAGKAARASAAEVSIAWLRCGRCTLRASAEGCSGLT